MVNENTILNFAITNKSKMYDAQATINCNVTSDGFQDYLEVLPNETEYEILAAHTKKGNLSVTLKRAVTADAQEVNITCQINASAAERETVGELSRTLKTANGAFWDRKREITKIVLENQMNPYQIDDSLIFDVSEKQDGGVMSYMVPNEEGDMYTLHIQADGTIFAPEDSSKLFAYFVYLESIEGLEYLDTSKVTNMWSMFGGTALKSIDLSSFDTSNVTNMGNMFNGCDMTSLDLTPLDTSNVTYMAGMFQYCSNLTSLDLTSLDTSSVTDMSFMFGSCSGLKSLDLSQLDTSNVTDMMSMFDGCSSLTSLDLTTLDTSNVTDMSGMFSSSSSLKSIVFGALDVRSVTTMKEMFSSCDNLANVDLSLLKMGYVSDMTQMFYNCRSLKSVVFPAIDTSISVNLKDLFAYCYELKSIDMSKISLNNISTHSGTFITLPLDCKLYVKDKASQQWVLNLNPPDRPGDWTATNVIVKS